MGDSDGGPVADTALRVDASVDAEAAVEDASRDDGDSSLATDALPPDAGPATCLHPAPGWNRLETAEIFAGGPLSGNAVGVHDVTQFDSIWGRDYAMPGLPITRQWPGVPQQLVMPQFFGNQYIAAQFRTPTTGQPSHTLVVEGTSFSGSGGYAEAGRHTAELSVTVSTVCGDFDPSSPNIPPSCSWNQLGNMGAVSIAMNYPPSERVCILQPDTDYYLNIIYAPLTTPASAVFNGLTGYQVVLFQNQGVSPR